MALQVSGWTEDLKASEARLLFSLSTLRWLLTKFYGATCNPAYPRWRVELQHNLEFSTNRRGTDLILSVYVLTYLPVSELRREQRLFRDFQLKYLLLTRQKHQLSMKYNRHAQFQNTFQWFSLIQLWLNCCKWNSFFGSIIMWNILISYQFLLKRIVQFLCGGE